MNRFVAVALALCCAAGAAFGAETTYSSQAEWEAALAGQPIRSLSLPNTTIPSTGATVDGDGVSIFFPPNHGGMWTNGDAWRGDAHASGTDPQFNLVTFDEPITAFSGSFDVGVGVGNPAFEYIFLRFGDGAFHQLTRETYKPAFFGWIGDGPVSQIRVSADDDYYTASAVRFVNAPEPATAWAWLALSGVISLTKRRRRHVA